MKNGFLGAALKALKVFGLILAASGVVCLVLYTQLWNPHVAVSVEKKGEFPLTAKQRLKDFEYLYKTLEASYPYFEVKKRQYGMDWLGQKGAFIDRIKAAGSDKEYYAVLEEILMLLQNGHTNIIAPGTEFEEFRQLYSGPQPWSQVFGNARVAECYDYWEGIIAGSEPATIPVAFRYIEGSYYAAKNLINPERGTEEFGVTPGSRLLSIDGVDVDDYIKNLAGQRLLRFDPVRKKFKINLLSIRADKETRLTLELASSAADVPGVRAEKLLKPYKADTSNDVGYTLPEHLYSTEILEQDRVAYLKLPSLASSYVDKDRQGLREFLKAVSRYSSLIIDIRGNGGGSTDYWMDNIVPLLTDQTLGTQNYLLFSDSKYIKPFIKQKMFFEYFGLKTLDKLSFSKENPGFYLGSRDGVYHEMNYTINPEKPVGFKGRIYLLVDDNVYSSAEAFAAFAKDTGWAQLVGTRTGGDGIGFDPVPVALPYSGLVVRFPADMGLNPDGSINEETATEPDIYAETSYEDFLARLEYEASTTEKPSVRDSLAYDTVLKKALELSRNQ